MRPANEKRRYNVKSFLWAHAQNAPCISYLSQKYWYPINILQVNTSYDLIKHSAQTHWFIHDDIKKNASVFQMKKHNVCIFMLWTLSNISKLLGLRVV